MSVAHCSWSDVSDGWDRWRDVIEQGDSVVTDALLAAIAPPAGLRVLELAAGTGELAARLAGGVGAGGSVLASDEADGMVRLLSARLTGMENVAVGRIDACAIPLDDDSYDAVVCRMGLMLVADPALAVAEIRRVLRPGGRVAAAVWGDPAANPWLATVGMAAMMQGLTAGAPPTGQAGPFSLADPEALHALFADAGFTQIAVDVVDGARRYASTDEHVDMSSSLAPALRAAVMTAPAEKMTAMRETVRQLTSAYLRADGGLELPLRALVVSATA
jgi:ubiquinone/menaquinone biosynthesis C-methylase UbiE